MILSSGASADEEHVMTNMTATPACPDDRAAQTIRPRRHPAVAAVLSLLLPGLGQWYAGLVARAVAWVIGEWAVVVACLVSLAYLPIAHANAAVAALLWVSFRIAAMLDAGRTTQFRRFEPVARHQRWWACVIVATVGLLLGQGFAHGVRGAWFEAFALPSEGMAETLMPGDRLLADKLWYRHQSLRHGDVIVFWGEGPGGVVFVQRVIGLPGDVIELRDKVVYRNGQPLDEPYVTHEWADRWSAGVARPETLNLPPTTVPAGELFLLGDNRWRSADSRHRGTVPVDDVIGRVMTVYWSHALPLEPPFGPIPPPHAEHERAIRWERVGLRVR